MALPPTFLLAVPFHSDLARLREMLASVQLQHDPQWSCVVVDDSPDEARAFNDIAGLVRSLADPRITSVANQGNIGIARTFQRCFVMARDRGDDLLTIAHADDLLEPPYVATMRAAHAAAPTAWCVAPQVTVIDASGSPTRTVPDTVKALLWPRHLDRLRGEQGLRLLLRGQFFYCPAVCYRVSSLSEMDWSDRWRQVMDLDLYGRLLLEGGTIVLDRRRVYRYRRHAESMTQRNSNAMLRTEEETAVCRELSAAARTRRWKRAARAGSWRLTVRLQGLLRAVMLLTERRWGAAADALVLSLRP